MNTLARTFAVTALGALALSGCAAAEADASASPSPSVGPAFAVTSADFVDGGALPESAKATAFGGQCESENISPQLTWTGAPEGTVAYAITFIDVSGGSYVHWTKADIPSTVTSIPSGGADAVAGAGGANVSTVGTYFGPCPPSGDRSYEFTVYALDATLALEEGFSIVDFHQALAGHDLAQASITGVASAG